MSKQSAKQGREPEELEERHQVESKERFLAPWTALLWCAFLELVAPHERTAGQPGGVSLVGSLGRKKCAAPWLTGLCSCVTSQACDASESPAAEILHSRDGGAGREAPSLVQGGPWQCGPSPMGWCVSGAGKTDNVLEEA